MDGTLVDSTAVVESAWAGWAKRYNLPLGEVLHFSHGRPTRATLEHFLPEIDHTSDLAELEAFELTELDGIKAVPGAAATVAAAARGFWAVVTSAPRDLAVARIRAAGLPLPNVLIPADEIRHGKPHPEGYLAAAAKLGVSPSDCVVFEDTRPGIKSGLSAGMQVVGLFTTFAPEELCHHPAVRDFRDIQIESIGEVFEITLTGT